MHKPTPPPISASKHTMPPLPGTPAMPTAPPVLPVIAPLPRGMMRCPTCQQAISKRAKACPHCGHHEPNRWRNPTGCAAIAGAVAIIVAVWALYAVISMLTNTGSTPTAPTPPPPKPATAQLTVPKAIAPVRPNVAAQPAAIAPKQPATAASPVPTPMPTRVPQATYDITLPYDKQWSDRMFIIEVRNYQPSVPIKLKASAVVQYEDTPEGLSSQRYVGDSKTFAGGFICQIPAGCEAGLVMELEYPRPNDFAVIARYVTAGTTGQTIVLRNTMPSPTLISTQLTLTTRSNALLSELPAAK
jgi:hypothetical protein